jgi:hypothetical protein
MTRAVVAAVLLLGAAIARAAGDHELLAAEQELKIAKDHLAAAGPEYQGHRREAMDLIDRALAELRRALEVSRAGQAEGKPGQRSRPFEKPAEQPDDD